MSNRNDHDSQQLATLRTRYRTVHPDRIATARRLGTLAGRRGITVSDYGTHSKRWVDAFTQGRIIGNVVRRNP